MFMCIIKLLIQEVIQVGNKTHEGMQLREKNQPRGLTLTMLKLIIFP